MQLSVSYTFVMILAAYAILPFFIYFIDFLKQQFFFVFVEVILLAKNNLIYLSFFFLPASFGYSRGSLQRLMMPPRQSYLRLQSG